MAGFAPGVPRALAGRYRLVVLLARGGMAEVWEGRDDVLSRPVAVKMLLPHLAADPSLRERFRREAVTAARLVHPGIVAIFDAGVEVIGGSGASPGTVLSGGWPRDESARSEATWSEQPSTAFIVMELVPGETLRDLMVRSGPLAPELAVAIASQVTDALAHAHAHGLVHRDVKPANILLRDEGVNVVRVKVADFGIAKAATTTADLTANGLLLGTPKYISPEQVQGREPDARADLYSLGVVMFEMLAGRPPFRAATDMATALAHVQQPAPDLGEVRPGLPTGLADLVGSLLVKDPDYRVESALALSAALASLRKRLGVPAAEPGVDLRLGAGTSVNLQAVPGAKPRPVKSGPPGARRPARRATAGTSGLAVKAGGGTLALPDGEVEVAPRANNGGAGPARRRHRRGRFTSLLVGSLLLAGLVVAVALLEGHRPAAPTHGHKVTVGTTVPGVASAPGRVKIVDIYELTQRGNLPNDNVAELKNLIGTDPRAYWESAQYHGPNFGNYGGFGLVLRLAGTNVLHELVVTAPMQDWSAEAFVSDTSRYPSSVGGWGQPTGRQTAIFGSHAFSLGGKRAGWVLLWMTNPGPSDQAIVDKLAVS